MNEGRRHARYKVGLFRCCRKSAPYESAKTTAGCRTVPILMLESMRSRLPIRIRRLESRRRPLREPFWTFSIRLETPVLTASLNDLIGRLESLNLAHSKPLRSSALYPNAASPCPSEHARLGL